MKVFYSELAVNPAYYSFGYSVYGEVEEGDELSDLYRQGFLPFVGAKKQSQRMMYLARGSRVRTQEFTQGHYHRYAKGKCGKALGPLTVVVKKKEDFSDVKELERFFLQYFSHRFGAGAMSHERLSAILASSLLTHIVVYQAGERVVGYTLETHGKDFFHVWYEAYEKASTKSCLGLTMFIDFVERAKNEGKNYAYLGVTCGTWMRYKTHFTPLEFFNGRGWVGDKKSVQLKRLLSTDSSRLLALTDSWRESLEPFYPPPYRYDEPKEELRLLVLLSEALPRTFVTFALLLFSFLCIFALSLFL